MKKIILCCVVSCVSVFADECEFCSPEDFHKIDWLSKIYGGDVMLKISGMLHTTVAHVEQKTSDSDEYKKETVLSHQGDVDIKMYIPHAAYAYGFDIQNIACSGLIKNGTPIVYTSYLFLENYKFGEFKFGYVNSASGNLWIDGYTFLPGYGGPGSGNISNFLGGASCGTIVDTGGIANSMNGTNSLKLLWISPLISGWQTGISYSLDSRYANLFRTYKEDIQDNAHLRHNVYEEGIVYAQNIVSFALTYEYGTPETLKIKTSFGALLGKGCSGATNIDVHNLCAYNIGIMFETEKCMLAFGYTDNGKSLITKNYVENPTATAAFNPAQQYDFTDINVGVAKGANGGEIYSAGFVYHINQFDLYTGYFRSAVKFSKTEKTTADIATLGIEYNINDKCSAYIEYNSIKTNTCDRARIYAATCNGNTNPNNRANVFFIGLKYSVSS